MTNLKDRVAFQGDTGDARNGAALVKLNGTAFKIIFSDGMGWDHVSISNSRRCPTWEEMCLFKDWFFEPQDVVVQFHPAQSDYVNVHPNCLHLWRCQTAPFPMPDLVMV